MIRIVPGRIEQAAELSALLAKVWMVAYRGIFPNAFLDNIQPDGWTQGLARTLADPNTHFLVAQQAEQIIGMLSFGLARDTDLAISYEIYAINILPEFQHQKIGSMLMASALNEYGLKDHAVYLRVARENNAAQQFYLKHGFINTRIEKIRHIADFSFTEWVYRR